MFPQEGTEDEMSLSGTTNAHQTSRAWNTRELIHALLPEELAEEIVSSSSNPLFFQQDDGGRSVLDSSPEWSAGTRFFVEGSETKESSSGQSLLPTNKSSSPKARELILRCFHEEKDQGLHYVALFEMESRRCLAGLSFDTEDTFEEGTALEHAHVLWNLSGGQ
ncbi:MAG: hypothetical protein H6728_08710 [Myxococcales bacterium]|nr:hypothetical protein [Myxococcales bacterium]